MLYPEMELLDPKFFRIDFAVFETKHNKKNLFPDSDAELVLTGTDIFLFQYTVTIRCPYHQAFYIFYAFNGDLFARSKNAVRLRVLFNFFNRNRGFYRLGLCSRGETYDHVHRDDLSDNNG